MQIYFHWREKTSIHRQRKKCVTNFSPSWSDCLKVQEARDHSTLGSGNENPCNFTIDHSTSHHKLQWGSAYPQDVLQELITHLISLKKCLGTGLRQLLEQGDIYVDVNTLIKNFKYQWYGVFFFFFHESFPLINYTTLMHSFLTILVVFSSIP